MKYSPLQLVRYLIPEISVSANSSFDPQKPIEARTDQFSVQVVVTQQEVHEEFKGHSWSIEMTITQKIMEGQNSPYTFRLSLVGLFFCKDGLPPKAEEERFVRVNGSSILYGAAREMMRSVTALGPWGALLLPTASFYESEAAQKVEGTTIPNSG